MRLGWGLLGNLLGPLIVFLSTPFIIRQHHESYVQYALLSGVIASLATIASGRYEMLLPLRESNERPGIVWRSYRSLFLSTVVAFVTSLSIYCIYSGINTSSLLISLILALMLFSQGIYQIAYYGLLASGRVNMLGGSKIVQALIVSLGQLVFGNGIALYLSEIFSRIVPSILVGHSLFSAPTKRENLASDALVKDDKFIRKAVLGALMSGISLQLPIYYLLQFSNSLPRLTYAALDKLVHMPILLVSTFLGQILFSKRGDVSDAIHRVFLAVSGFVVIVVLASQMGRGILNELSYRGLHIIILLIGAYLLEGVLFCLSQVELSRESRGRYMHIEVLRMLGLITVFLFALWTGRDMVFLSGYIVVYLIIISTVCLRAMMNSSSGNGGLNRG